MCARGSFWLLNMNPKLENRIQGNAKRKKTTNFCHKHILRTIHLSFSFWCEMFLLNLLHTMLKMATRTNQRVWAEFRMQAMNFVQNCTMKKKMMMKTMMSNEHRMYMWAKKNLVMNESWSHCILYTVYTGTPWMKIEHHHLISCDICANTSYCQSFHGKQTHEKNTHPHANTKTIRESAKSLCVPHSIIGTLMMSKHNTWEPL